MTEAKGGASNSGRRLRLLTLAVSATLVLTFLGSLAALGVALYGRSLSDVRSVAVALQQYALRTVMTGDLLATVAADRLLMRGTVDGLPNDRAMHDILKALAARLPEGSGMILVDPAGQLVSSFDSFPAQPVDLSDRDWVRAHHEGADLVITDALVSRVTGRTMFIMTRAVRRPDGSLLGIVNLGVPADSLIGEHALPQYGDGVALLLINTDGGFMAGSDFRPDLVGQHFRIDDPPRPPGFVKARERDGRMAVEATDVNRDYGLTARASIPLLSVFRPLLWVAVVGLPLLSAMLWGTVHLMRSLVRQQRLQEQTSNRLRAVLEASHLGSWHYDLRTNTSDMNARWAQIIGHTPAEIGVSVEEWSSRLHPDERDAVTEAINDTLAGRSPVFHIEHRMRHKDGHWVWVLDSGAVVERDAEGKPLVMTGTLLDISERRDAEQRVRVLMRELDHRAKNLLAVVYSIANLMKGDDVEAFKKALLGRVQALGHVHSLLSQNAWQGVEIGPLIRTETAAYQSDEPPRIVAEGPPLFLSASAAQALAMVVHELMTNSAKYGALSSQTGLVRLGWGVDEEAIHLRWAEEGGPKVAKPERRGFGTTLLKAMIRNQLDGTIRADWHEGGAVFEISFARHHLRSEPPAEAA